MFYRKLLDGFYTGTRVEYVGEFKKGTFTLYKDGGVLINLEPVAQLNEHYTHPDLMSYYNLAAQLIKEGEHEEY